MIGAPIAARCLAIRGGRRTHVRAALLVALVALSALVVSAAAAPNYPELTGRVTDEAGLLSAADKADIERVSLLPSSKPRPTNSPS